MKRIISIIYVEGNVLKMCVKFQLIPLMAAEKKILEKKKNFMLQWQIIKFGDLDKNLINIHDC